MRNQRSAILKILKTSALSCPQLYVSLKLGLYIMKENFWNCLKYIGIEKRRSVNFSNFGLMSDFLTQRFTHRLND